MVYIVAVIACALYFVIHFIDKLYYQKRKQKQNTKELKRLVEDINYELANGKEDSVVVEEANEENNEEVIYIEPVLEAIKEDEVVEVKTAEVPLIEVEPSVTKVIEEQMAVFVEEVEEQEKVAVLEPIAEVEEIIDEEQINAVNNIEIEEISVEEVLDYTSAEPNQTEAQAELRRLTEALEQAEEANKNIDLTSYEEMQEKEAIISLEELMKRSKEMYESNELTQYADEGNEPICLEDLERKVRESLEVEETVEVSSEPIIEQMEFTEVLESVEPEIIAPVVQEKMVMDDFYSVQTNEVKKSSTAYQQYKSMPVISPIYGIERKGTSSLELENTANYEKLDEEIKKTNEFIMTLKELQENLD